MLERLDRDDVFRVVEIVWTEVVSLRVAREVAKIGFVKRDWTERVSLRGVR